MHMKVGELARSSGLTVRTLHHYDAIGLLRPSAVFTWVQRRVPPAMLGRAMSLFMFIFMGLVPLASAVTGWLLRYLPLPHLFAGSGALLVAAAAVAWVATPLRRVSDAPA